MKSLIRVWLAVYGLILVAGVVWDWTQTDNGIATGWILYVVDPTGSYENREIYRIRIDGNHPFKLTHSGGDNVAPFTSPHLSWFTFMSDHHAERGNFNIYRMSFNGTNSKNLTPDLRTVSSPHVSPNGKWMVMTVSDENAIYHLDLQTGALTLLAEAEGRVLDISADSQWIFYVNGNTVYRSHPDGSAQENLTEAIGNIQAELVLSPDGEWLVYTTYDDNGHALYRSHLDGTDQRALTPVIAEYVYPEISPDGQWIVYLDQNDIYRIRIDGTRLKNLTQSPFTETSHSITPDGKWIVYTSAESGHNEIYRMRLDGSAQKRLTNHKLDATALDFISAPARKTQHRALLLLGIGFSLGALILPRLLRRRSAPEF